MVTALVWKTWDVGSSPTFGTFSFSYKKITAGIAQLVERLLAKEKVAGPNPVSRSFFYPDPEGHLAQLVERFVYIEDVGGPSPSVAT